MIDTYQHAITIYGLSIKENICKFRLKIVVLLTYSKQNGKNAILATASHKYYSSNMTHPRK